jgi:sugar phosphate isomerase/epimerase
LTAGVALSRAHGFRFGFEHNEPATGLFGEPEYCAAALEAVPDVGFVWDVNHTRPDQLDAYLAFAPRMSMLHLADTPLPEVNHHLPIGMGNIDFGYCFHELLRVGFDGPGILEIGGLPRSGGYGRDTDVALIESRTKLLNILQKETNDE